MIEIFFVLQPGNQGSYDTTLDKVYVYVEFGCNVLVINKSSMVLLLQYCFPELCVSMWTLWLSSI